MKLGRLFLIAVFSIVWSFALPAFAACEGDASPAYNTAISFSSSITLSEVYPAPADGQEEFIELQNTSGVAVDLAGWKLKDASGKTHTINQGNIPGGGFFSIPQSISKIYLNNDTDNIQLLQPNDNVLANTTYSGAKEGESWAYSEGKWQWTTTPTAGSANKIKAPEPDSSESGDDKKDDNDTTTDPKAKTSSDVLLSELLPDPTGVDSTDEWIEIENTGKSAVYLGGWQLTDESTYYTIDAVTIAAGDRIIFEVGDTNISLNNTGDHVYLIDPFGKIINGTTYENSTEGAAWARFDNDWKWTSTPTPGEKNVLTENAETDDSSGGGEPGSGENENGDEQPDTDTIPIELFRSLDDGKSATVEGVVTVLPGVFGSQYFYIQDDSAGIQVYSYSKTFPSGLAVGDRIRVTGEKSTARGETRIKVHTVEDFTIVGHGETVTPRDVTQLDESSEGLLVQTEGTVVQKSGGEAIINDSLTVAIKDSANIDSSLLEEGKSIAIIGIVSESNTEYRMMPRSNDDITTIEPDNAAIPSADASSGFFNSASALASTDPQHSKQVGIFVIVIVGLLTIMVAMIVQQKKDALTRWWKKKQGVASLEKQTDEPQTILDIARKKTQKK